ncbi:Hypothetical protein A7982_05920 [Minicystis rosea]|nr:Hypothetical protein A7982_05920 [Minicystis rosea]
MRRLLPDPRHAVEARPHERRRAARREPPPSVVDHGQSRAQPSSADARRDRSPTRAHRTDEPRTRVRFPVLPMELVPLARPSDPSFESGSRTMSRSRA